MERMEWAVGRRKKFGEEPGFVNIRVPKSKVSEYRAAIKKLVDEKFSLDSSVLPKEEETTENYERESVTFRDFREFGQKVGEEDVSKALFFFYILSKAIVDNLIEIFFLDLFLFI